MSQATTIRAEGRVPMARERVFGLLSDLDNHRALTDRGIEILALDGPAGARVGGTVELRGPVGLTRTARTRVEGAEFPDRLWGTAVTTNGTEAALEWSLRATAEGTLVAVQVRLRPRHWSDRLLLRAGGGRWLLRRLTAAIGRLAAG